ncbi:MAG: 50S ribosomal protein L29 [Caldisphaeraceae archaeon]|nr:50S ribosomal protein L29 [Caldisphaeraceae archaeon]MEB2793430.1 50S ribosomal protein L29 [Caldisphaeraceae archaeon]MEB3691372.1 50S ribosomal protein L29 [Caldisphaeraceae archaeon]MEB3798531.1 50S ribosomal protein L29 [Caldisphaeraceae archaeon]
MGKYRLRPSDIRKMSDDELEKNLRDLISDLTVLRHKAYTGSLDNPARIRQVRKNIARILTIMNERKGGRKG